MKYLKNKEQEYDIVRPEPDSLLQSIRSFGYTLETAISDLIDNSVTANSEMICIDYGIDRFSSFVRIEDNGDGMDEEELVNAMKIGSFNPLNIRGENDLGRFGLGLKTASFSQCKRLTVKTRKKSGKEFIRCWDLDIVAHKKEWVLLKECIDQVSLNHLSEFSFKNSGTIVLWEKLDRLIESTEIPQNTEHFYRKFDNVRKHLGLIFHRFIETNKIQLFVKDEKISGVNPFNISVNFPSNELQEEQLSISNQLITIQPYILPHESKLNTEEKSSLELIKSWNEHQGIYLYRNERLIADGTWLDLDIRKKEIQRLCRIRIDIPNTLDKEWQIDVKKASAKIPDEIRKRVKKICLTSIDKAIKVYSNRGAYIKRNIKKEKIIYLWITKIKHGVKTYQINEKHPLFELIVKYLKDDSKIFKQFTKLISEALPINLILNDFSDPNTILETPNQNNKEALLKIYKSALKVLTDNGVSEKEAIYQLNNMDIFQQLNNK